MEEGKSAMEEVCGLIEQLRAELDPVPTPASIDRAAITSEADRWVAIAADFPRIAREATGSELRALLRPWLQGATFDKHSRELVVRVQTVPVSLLAKTETAGHHDSKGASRELVPVSLLPKTLMAEYAAADGGERH
jgi:hypothetical protein